MYYSSGNYEAFARPRKPINVEEKSAYIIGSGLAALSAACFLVRDGQMDGKHIHILEKDPVAGGACDGMYINDIGYVMGMDNFKTMKDLMEAVRCFFDALEKGAGIGLRKELRIHDVNLLNEMDEEDKKMFDKIV